MKETEDINFRIDIIDSDGRSILYNCIKFNYFELITLLLDFDKTNINFFIIQI